MSESSLDFGLNTAMPARSFDDANVFYRAMRAVAVTKAGRVVFRPTAHRLDQIVSKLTGGKRSFAGIAAGLRQSSSPPLAPSPESPAP
jgi:hypothetical protein